MLTLPRVSDARVDDGPLLFHPDRPHARLRGIVGAKVLGSGTLVALDRPCRRLPSQIEYSTRGRGNAVYATVADDLAAFRSRFCSTSQGVEHDGTVKTSGLLGS
jgi:hypothetical protein